MTETFAFIAWPKRVLLWLLEELRWLLRVLVSSSERFYWDNGFSKAASLAYTTLLSLVPVTALGFGLLASFAQANQALPEVRKFIFRQFVPSTEAVDTVLQYLTEYSTVISSLNVLSVVFLVVTSVLLINSIEYALNEIWQVYEARPISARIGIYSAVLVVAPVLALSAYYFTKLRFGAIFDEMGLGWYLGVSYSFLLPFLIDFVAFLSLYYLVPKAPVRARSALFGAFIGAILFGVAKTGFVIYVEGFSSYYAIYQTLAAIPIFLFWNYLAWSIVLFGAEVSYQAQYLPRRGKLWKRTVQSVGDARLVLAIQSLAIITRAFDRGQKLPSDLELATVLGCSTVVLKPALDALGAAGILGRGDSREMPLTLLKNPESISIADLKRALFGDRDALKFCAELALLYQAIGDGSRGLGEVSLAEIVRRPTIPA